MCMCLTALHVYAAISIYTVHIILSACFDLDFLLLYHICYYLYSALRMWQP